MPDTNREFDIPVLTDVLVPGKSVPASSATPTPTPAPRADGLPVLQPQAAPETAGSGLPPAETHAPLSTAYDAPAGAAGADALPVARLAPGPDETRLRQARPPAADGALGEAGEVPAAPAEPHAPAPAAGAAAPDVPDVPDVPAPFVAPEPAVPHELAGAPQPEPAADPELNASGARFASPDTAARPQSAEAAPASDVPDAPFAPEPATPQASTAAPEPVAAPEEARAPLTPPAHSGLSDAEAAFVAPEPAVAPEFAAMPEPLAAPQPGVASVTSPPAAAPHEAGAAPLVGDDEHDAPDDGSLAYALADPEQAAEQRDAGPVAAGGRDASGIAAAVDAPADSDVVARTESALHAIEAMPPAAFAELTPFGADEPMPARFADQEAPPPAELQHGAPEPLPVAAAPAPVAPAVDARRLAERLHGRVAGYLAGEGRALIDARCRELVQQHAAALAEEVSQQVLLALAPEIEQWVSEAVGEALADHPPPPA
ncbi:DUF2486 family protein [Burkholderia glumae]|uniref:DUF2486 family protein n=1 Tax=Burkholderia glumae TaxID=337 RepID=A0AAP9Y3F7_BURGL|nr:DUF2486 family protein [Burkholderia glumae]ACR29894.1 Hypothetical protein bglu_1g28280 [Burkholderia glumae BGR1]AJY67193.1 hypothetical protein KS03_279 [Burkholderia glumae LMG 2196 = ATCC 33617]KHJ60451.1 hypothetical protein NCPPB3923_24010 [Burkholderia glumae]MCM2482485.1 DUF2486 family protein [Burkholderia glumae]MCM2507372.1 DUF2486 family protein [Burkholderia glumae]